MKRTAKMCPQYLSGIFKDAREEDKWYEPESRGEKADSRGQKQRAESTEQALGITEERGEGRD
jgi:hypothetical protein